MYLINCARNSDGTARLKSKMLGNTKLFLLRATLQIPRSTLKHIILLKQLLADYLRTALCMSLQNIKMNNEQWEKPTVEQMESASLGKVD